MATMTSNYGPLCFIVCTHSPLNDCRTIQYSPKAPVDDPVPATGRLGQSPTLDIEYAIGICFCHTFSNDGSVLPNIRRTAAGGFT